MENSQIEEPDPYEHEDPQEPDDELCDQCGEILELASCEHLHCPDCTWELHLALGVCSSEECAIKQANVLMRKMRG